MSLSDSMMASSPWTTCDVGAAPFDLYETSWHRGLVGTDGWLEMRPMTDGGAPVTIVDS